MCAGSLLPGHAANDIARTWFNGCTATLGTVKGHETRPDGLARNRETNYQSMYRYGSHQSAHGLLAQADLIGRDRWSSQGHVRSVDHERASWPTCTALPVGAARAFRQADKGGGGGLGAKGLWRPAGLGFRPTYESDAP